MFGFKREWAPGHLNKELRFKPLDRLMDHVDDALARHEYKKDLRDYNRRQRRRQRGK